MLKGEKILVTGASGYVGSWLSEYALRDGAHVRILLRKIPPYLSKWASKFEVVLGDITDPKTLPKACRGSDIIWHAASANETICASDFEKALMVNVMGTRNILEAASQENVGIFIKLSTFHVYGYNGNGPLSEDMSPSPSSIYGLTNLMGDLLGPFFCKTKGLKVLIARVSNGYGAPLFKETDRWTLVINDLCRRAFERKEIVLRSSGVQQRDFVSISDIFSALRILSTTPTDESLFHVGGGASQSILEIAQRIKHLYDLRYGGPIRVIAPSPKPQEVSHSVQYDISKLRALGYCSKKTLDTEINRIFDLLEK